MRFRVTSFERSTAVTARRPEHVRVLHTVSPATEHGNPFVSLMIGSLPASIHSDYFSWSKALLRRHEVVHFQWPEKFVSDTRPLGRAVKRLLFSFLLSTLRARRTAVVLTIHNLAAHEGSDQRGAAMLLRLEAMADVLILLNSTEHASDPAREVVIPHGNYRPVVKQRQLRPDDPNRLVFFGLIREYKNVPTLIDAFELSKLATSGHSLAIVGKPHSQVLRASVAAAAAGARAVSVRLESLPEGELQHEILRSGIVVLPYKQLYNSGAILMALSLDRPVVVPSTPTTREFQKEFGDQWIITFEPPLTGVGLAEAVAKVAESQPDRLRPPDLDALEWSRLGTDYERAYRTALARRRKGPESRRPR